MSANVKASELRGKQRSELTQQVADLKNELAALRVQKVASGSANKVAQIRTVRKAIARVLTVIQEGDLAAVKASLVGKKYLPKNLRVKTTRAMRRRLTKEEASRQTLRQRKKAPAKKLRNYAIKA